MSCSFALVKFKKTGNIYYGCYNGTSDIMIPFLCTPQECYDEKLDCYCAITYCRELSYRHESWKFPEDVTDLDDIEIYSDYGGGFYWSGTGSESIKMIDDFLDPWEAVYEDMKHGVPEWVEEFLKQQEENNDLS